jgi:hypothetical protein
MTAMEQGHCITIGMTRSGKSIYNKRRAAWFKKHGIGVVVLDCMKDPGWNADFITKDPDEFMDFVWDPSRCLQCALFIDEAGYSLDKYSGAADKLTTQGRHLGHVVHLITQRAVMVSVNIRSQCDTVIAFQVNRNDAKTYANDWNCEKILDAPNLPQGHFICATRFRPVTYGRLW